MSSTNGHKPKSKGGRPTSYKAAYCEQARKLAECGLTDAEVAAFFGVNQVTLYRWQAAHPEFCKSLKLGKESSDARVERSLFHRANGYSHEAVKIFCDPKTGAERQVKYTEHYPPDTTACIFWLKNRRPAEWRDRVENVVQVVDEKGRAEALITAFLAEFDGKTNRDEAIRILAPEFPEVRELGKIG